MRSCAGEVRYCRSTSGSMTFVSARRRWFVNRYDSQIPAAPASMMMIPSAVRLTALQLSRTAKARTAPTTMSVIPGPIRMMLPPGYESGCSLPVPRMYGSYSSAERRLAGQGLADDELVDLRGALVGQHRFEVVGVPHDRVLAADAVRGQDGPALPG